MTPKTVASFAREAITIVNLSNNEPHSSQVSYSPSDAPALSLLSTSLAKPDLQYINYDNASASQLESESSSDSGHHPGCDGSCQPSENSRQTRRSLAPPRRLQRTTSNPVRRTRSTYPWTPTEEACLISLMKEIVQTESNKTEARWVRASEQMALHGYTRSPLGIKMIWGRGLREKTGIDERVIKRTDKMTVGVNWGRLRRDGGLIREGSKREERRGWSL